MARRMLIGLRLLDPAEQVDGRTLPVGGRQAWHRAPQTLLNRVRKAQLMPFSVPFELSERAIRTFGVSRPDAPPCRKTSEMPVPLDSGLRRGPGEQPQQYLA